MPKPVLVTTEHATTFLLLCKGMANTPANAKAARDHIYYLAKKGDITRHGVPKRGQALWDLQELAKPYGRTITIVVP